MAEAALDHHAQGGDVVTVLREGVRGQQPAAFAQRGRDIEDVEVRDLRLEDEREDRQLVAASQELERAEPRDRVRQTGRDVAGVLLDLAEALEAQAQEGVVPVSYTHLTLPTNREV